MVLLGQLLDSKGHAVHAIAPGASVIDAIRSMAQNHVGALLVMDGTQLAGIVSERDYARKVILLGRSSATTAVRDIMSAPVVSLPPGSSVDEAMRLMTDRRIRHLPVVESGRVLGVVSIGDLVKSVIEEQRHTIDDLHSYIRG
ncbi:MAG: CBS domain-containing protein [Proteobacteria bacterium]|mgnify:CR=1 FL=1|jgi:CBS domain-containing protein|nr:CBS domain-containing protein [Pseudomonadota bacterium]MBK7116884.1 CBS domain-containing protein [Pseudomonadota bacterium]MCC6630740.1 CBS domain-containing protein [Gammaproteobacteria bacterium]